jgi:hypothetical protein
MSLLSDAEIYGEHIAWENFLYNPRSIAISCRDDNHSAGYYNINYRVIAAKNSTGSPKRVQTREESTPAPGAYESLIIIRAAQARLTGYSDE